MIKELIAKDQRNHEWYANEMGMSVGSFSHKLNNFRGREFNKLEKEWLIRYFEKEIKEQGIDTKDLFN